MALNNGTADALAAAIVTALGLTGDQATQATAHWQNVTRTLYSSLKTDAVVTIPSSAIATSGSATNQVGPPAPVNLSLS